MRKKTKISVAGVGFVGGAVADYFESKKVSVSRYDKFKEGMMDPGVLLDSDIVFLCLPTLFSGSGYDKEALREVCEYLEENDYQGIAVVKSTVDPGTCRWLNLRYGLKIVHNPEFLTARTALEDFSSQKHIVLGGITENDPNVKVVRKFYKKYFKETKYSTPIAEESELMKLSCNAFYAVKVQFFNEIYDLCEKMNDVDYENVTQLMLSNGWINEMHTKVPGPDGLLSYGGACFPKDTQALKSFMNSFGAINAILGACIDERDGMRND
jgi:nucleotide sugar dehydrogenase